VSNVIKHSEASHCEVRCSIEDRSLVLTVRDDGKGNRRRPAPRPGHVEHEAARQEDERPVPRSSRVPGYGVVISLTVPL
jgi:nitrate/nitrite-specific signal transduction histidine kinase